MQLSLSTLLQNVVCKYFLGLTTITQDVEDFLSSDYGKAVVSNSSMQILLKQSPAAVDKIQKAFYLSDGERNFLLSAGVGEGLFFAGANHVGIQVIASKNEHMLITTNPGELKAAEDELTRLNTLDFKKKMVSASEVADTVLSGWSASRRSERFSRFSIHDKYG